MLGVKYSKGASHLRPSSLHPPGRAPYATVRGLRPATPPDLDDAEPVHNDFIMSILHAKPSARDSKNYLASFGARPAVDKSTNHNTFKIDPFEIPPLSTQTTRKQNTALQVQESPVLASILNPVYRRTALVKVQGPFTDRQLESIARGLVYLEKLGLVSVIVVEDDNWERGEPNERSNAIEACMRVTQALEQQGAKARPLLETIVRLGPKPEDEIADDVSDVPEAHAFPKDLNPIRSSLRAGEIPVLPPLALDSFCRSVRVHSNDVIAALARGMVEAASHDTQVRGGSSTTTGVRDASASSDEEPSFTTQDMDLTPLRLMIINREGGIPSYARSGFPHLLINLESEYSHIHSTFDHRWWSTNPSALSNVALARTCLNYMPPTSSAIVVSHRSQKSLIGNLITNKPALSSSLPHALLQGTGTDKLNKDTPTILRRGLDIRVIKNLKDIDKTKMTRLLEQSFKRNLNQNSFYERLAKRLDFVIVAGDYAGAAIVTNEPYPGYEHEDTSSSSSSSSVPTLAYLDKFAVLPEHQGDGTVDFLWVALHDESYGLGLPYSVNPNGGNEGQGSGRDLVWRSRANNPVNKWYFERSSGHIRLGDWVMFWCDAEARLKGELLRKAAHEGRSRAQLSYLEQGESGRMLKWAGAVTKIESCWT